MGMSPSVPTASRRCAGSRSSASAPSRRCTRRSPVLHPAPSSDGTARRKVRGGAASPRWLGVAARPIGRGGDVWLAVAAEEIEERRRGGDGRDDSNQYRGGGLGIGSEGVRAG